MSTSLSQYYGLHTWAPEDNFLRTEFNDNFSTLDAALHALDGALYELIRVGSYTGNGEASQFINLGFTPRAVAVMGSNGAMSDNYAAYAGMALAGTTLLNSWNQAILQVENQGFRVYYQYTSGSSVKNPMTNSNGRMFNFFAIR